MFARREPAHLRHQACVVEQVVKYFLRLARIERNLAGLESEQVSIEPYFFLGAADRYSGMAKAKKNLVCRLLPNRLALAGREYSISRSWCSGS